TPSLNPYVTAVLEGMEEEARRNGKLITLATFPTGAQEEREIIRAMTDPPVVDGLLFFLPSLQMESLIRGLIQRKFPMVVASERRFENLLPAVIIDNFNGAKQATEYLISKGHKRIGIIKGRPDMSDSMDRLEGYKTALREAGLTFEENLVVQGNYDIPSGSEAAEKFLEMADPPSAVFASNDGMAIGALRTLQIRKKEGAFAIMGFDDIQTSSFVTPTLTTVGYDLHELGRQAVHKLIRQILGEEKVQSTLQLKTHLIVRESA
ncbi:MAG TPA: substrate-binding domain-containing protein, partial [bacterium]|nr:substrate-binding domain-containing protein [bacterium]